MKLLFVCRSNVGRSQMAASFYNAKHPRAADSAGTAVDVPGQVLSHRARAKHVIEAMYEIGIDMRRHKRTQLHEKDLEKYDKVIVMAESNTIPDYLKAYDDVEFWDVDDPAFMDLDETRQVRDRIKSLVAKLKV